MATAGAGGSPVYIGDAPNPDSRICSRCGTEKPISCLLGRRLNRVQIHGCTGPYCLLQKRLCATYIQSRFAASGSVTHLALFCNTMDAEHVQFQLDFTVVSRSSGNLSERVGCVNNVAAGDGGCQLAESLERIMTHLDQIQTEMREGFAVFLSALEAMNRDNSVRDHKCQIRPENSTELRGDGALKPLHSFGTGLPIQRFPTTANEVMRLWSREVNRLLTSLRLDTDGTIIVRRRRLLVVCGATHLAV